MKGLIPIMYSDDIIHAMATGDQRLAGDVKRYQIIMSLLFCTVRGIKL
jgi:hypothetical protein